MGSLSNLYISQSYQSLIHLGSDTTITTASVQLQDGAGNGTGVFVNSLGNVFLSGSLTASLQQGYVWVGDGNNRTKLVATSSFSGGSGSDLTSLNAFTASQDTKNSTLANVTASLNANTASQQSQINSLIAFTSSQDTKNSTLASYTGSNDTKWNTLGGQTGSYVTSAITASSLVTASVNLNTITFTKGNGTTFAITVNTGSSGGTVPAGTISSSAQITSLGFVSSSVTASSLVTASFSGNTLTFTKGDSSTFGVVIPDVSGSGVPAGTVSSSAQIVAYNIFATTGSNTFVGNQTISSSLFISGNINMVNGADLVTHHVRAAGSNGLELQNASSGIIVSMGAGGGTQASFTGAVTANSISASSITGIGNVTDYSTSVDSRLDQLEANSGSSNSSITSLNAYTASNDTKWNTLETTTASFSASVASISALTASYATTGSNVFIGDETFADASGNASTLSPYSGSLVLVGKGLTSGSAGLSHLSASANQVNLVFKNSNANNGTTTISGSANILLSPSAPTAGFKRFVGSQNILLTTVVPEMTGSITYSPTINSNYANSVIRFRGPASSSAWTFNNNIVNGNLNVGNADATSANQAIAGGQIITNILLAAVNYNAYTTPLVAQAVFQSNLSVGNSTLTAFSSSINAQNNIFVGNTFTVNNRYFGTSSTPAAQRLSLQNNVFGGLSTPTLTAEGSNTTAAAPREVHGNTTNGNGLAIGVVLSGDNSNLYSTLIHGSNLTVTGSNAYNTPAGAGSAFIGRNNALNGTRASSGETIFAVGTGTNATTGRKTGFLIDSGSNTFIDGTLNVTGSTSLNGALNVSGGVYSPPIALSITSLTASLDATLGSTYTLTLVSGSTTHLLVSGQRVGQTYNLLVTQPASGTGSVQIGPNVYQPSGSAYVATPTSNAEDILTLVTFNNTAKTYIANVTNFI